MRHIEQKNRCGILGVLATILISIVFLAQSSCGSAPADGIYLDWWSQGTISGLFALRDIRTLLFEHNLFDTYADFPENVPCGDNALIARTIDGTCNDLEQTMMGSAGMRFGRNVPISSTYPDMDNLMEPNPRTVSRELLVRGRLKESGHLSYLAAAWIQFMIHDWFAHDNDRENYYAVSLSPDDPLYNPDDPFMYVPKTQVDPSQDPNDGQPPAYKNRVTHWWDGSQIYGSDQATNDSIRSFQDGKILTDEQGRLPIDPETGVAVTGFTENWWVGLAMFHQLFVMEHNAIADMLKTAYPSWDDQELYDTARLINAAVMAKIHTLDWTPAILKNEILREAMTANWNGLFNLGNVFLDSDDPVLAGIIGSTQAHFSAPYSLTEEFTAVYRMHSLLRDSLPVRDYETTAVIADVTLEDSAGAKATDVLEGYGMANLFYSMGHVHPGALSTNNYPGFLTEFTVPGPAGLRIDLAATDIVRDRERGIPRYNEFRRLIGLQPMTDFSDITDDAELVGKMRTVYGNDIEKLDALIGQLAEGHRPPGFGFGETAFQIFIVMASRRLQSDRFFTDDYTPEYYTEEGLCWIEEASINIVLLRHMPELRPALEKVGNAFLPWEEDSSKW